MCYKDSQSTSNSGALTTLLLAAAGSMPYQNQAENVIDQLLHLLAHYGVSRHSA